MAHTDIKATARRVLEEIFPTQDRAALDEVISDDYVNHELPPGAPQGREGMARSMAMLGKAFSDQRWEIHQALADGDTVVLYCTHTGSFTGEFMGMQPTGRRFAYHQVHIVRFVDGRGVEGWAVRDDATFMRQVSGELPATT